LLFKGRGRRKAVDQGVGGVSSADEESEVERLGETDGDGQGQGQGQSRPKLRPFRRGRRRGMRSNPNPENEDGNEDEGVPRDDLELENEEDTRHMVTPKATRLRDDDVQSTPCPSAPQRDAHVGSGGGEFEPDDMMSRSGRPARAGQEGADRADVGETGVMLQSKKRLREEEMELSLSPLPEVELETSIHDRPSTPVDDVHVRRKRIRR